MNGTDVQLVKLMAEGLNTITVAQNRRDARHCRDAMHAYRALRGADGLNSVPPSTLAASMTERKAKHRVPRDALTAGIRLAAQLSVTEKMRENAIRVKHRKEQHAIRQTVVARAEVRAKRIKARMNDRREAAKKAKIDKEARDAQCHL